MDKNLFKNHDYEKIKDNLVSWLQERVNTAGLEGAVVGLSGGIDSAVTARLCQLAFGENLLTVIMPCHSSSNDREDALKIANKFQMQVVENDLSDVYDHLLNELQSTGIKGDKLAEARSSWESVKTPTAVLKSGVPGSAHDKFWLSQWTPVSDRTAEASRSPSKASTRSESPSI